MKYLCLFGSMGMLMIAAFMEPVPSATQVGVVGVWLLVASTHLNYLDNRSEDR